MRRGTQIVYVPGHAEGDVGHPDSEAGFVWRWAGDGVAVCRFWNRYDKDALKPGTRRCDLVNLVLRKTVDDGQVEKWVRILEAEENPVDSGEKGG